MGPPRRGTVSGAGLCLSPSVPACPHRAWEVPGKCHGVAAGLRAAADGSGGGAPTLHPQGQILPPPGWGEEVGGGERGGAEGAAPPAQGLFFFYLLIKSWGCRGAWRQLLWGGDAQLGVGWQLMNVPEGKTGLCPINFGTALLSPKSPLTPSHLPGVTDPPAPGSPQPSPYPRVPMAEPCAPGDPKKFL